MCYKPFHLSQVQYLQGAGGLWRDENVAARLSGSNAHLREWALCPSLFTVRIIQVVWGN